MTPKELRARLEGLNPETPRHHALEHALREGVGYGGAWYRSQKEHWMGWLAEYDGPGAYGRSEACPRDAAFIWTHIQCAPMLFWLAEALNLAAVDLERAYEAVIHAPKRNASQCAALRRVFPWAVIEAALPEPKRTLARWVRGFWQG